MNTIELQMRVRFNESSHIHFIGVDLVIDGEIWDEMKDYAVSLDDFEASLTSDGEFFIITCCCGDASCAGIEEGIHVTHDGQYVYWHQSFPKFPSQLTFGKDEYSQVFDKLMAQAKQITDELQNSSPFPMEITPFTTAYFFKERLNLKNLVDD